MGAVLRAKQRVKRKKTKRNPLLPSHNHQTTGALWMDPPARHYFSGFWYLATTFVMMAVQLCVRGSPVAWTGRGREKKNTGIALIFSGSHLPSHKDIQVTLGKDLQSGELRTLTSPTKQPQEWIWKQILQPQWSLKMRQLRLTSWWQPPRDPAPEPSYTASDLRTHRNWDTCCLIPVSWGTRGLKQTQLREHYEEQKQNPGFILQFGS